MPSLSFKLRFVPYVEDGSKRHSIRAYRNRPFTVGDTCHLFTAMRTKQCRLLGRAKCTKVQPIRIDRARVWIDGEELSLDEKNALAWADGFRHPVSNFDGNRARSSPLGCFDLMLQFWAKTHGDKVFNGQIIFWDWNNRCQCESDQVCELCAGSKKAKQNSRAAA